MFNKINFSKIDYLYHLNYYINNLLILFAFSIPFSKNLNKTIGIIIFILWIFEGNLKEKVISALNNRTILVFVIFVAYSYISIVWSNNTQSAIYYVNKYFYYFTIIIVFTSIKKEFITKIITSFLLAMFISEIITFGIYFDFWTTAYNEKMNNSFPTAFMGHTAYSLFVVFTLFLTLNKLFFKKNNSILIKIIYILLLMLTLGNMFISGGRTGLLIIFFVFISISIVNLRKNPIIFFLSSFSLSLILIVGYQNISIFKSRVDKGYSDIAKIINNSDFNTPWGARVGLIYVGLKMAEDDPLLGVGIVDNRIVRNQYVVDHSLDELMFFNKNPKWSKSGGHFHNEYIEILTSIGFVGLFIFIYFLYNISNIKINSIEYKNIKIIFILVLIFGITTSALFHQRHNIALFSLFIGILLAQSKFEQEEIQIIDENHKE